LSIFKTLKDLQILIAMWHFLCFTCALLGAFIVCIRGPEGVCCQAIGRQFCIRMIHYSLEILIIVRKLTNFRNIGFFAPQLFIGYNRVWGCQTGKHMFSVTVYHKSD
ncbi:hypothetical protein ACJX0J_022705, partial [Zea mays]